MVLLYHDSENVNDVLDGSHRLNRPRSRNYESGGVACENPLRAASLRAFNRDLDSSESIPSDHSSIYDAARESLVLEDNGQACYQTVTNDSTARDEVSPAVGFSVLPDPILLPPWRKAPVNALATITEQSSTSTLRHSGSASQFVGSIRGGDLRRRRSCESSVAASSDSWRRKAASFNDIDGGFRTRHWLRSDLSPVLPTQPAHPPPVRSPTPPGLPSFGTVEALRYSSLFMEPSSAHGVRRQRHPPHVESDGRRSSQESTRSASHRTALRRIFGVPPQPESRPIQTPLSAIARAQDGTAVRGRFPNRQSGHGVDLSRHPFHQRALPLAPHSYQDRETHPDENSRSKTGDSGNGRALPSFPEPAVTAKPRMGSTTATILWRSRAQRCQAATSRNRDTRASGHDMAGSSARSVDGSHSVPDLFAAAPPFMMGTTQDGTSETRIIEDEKPMLAQLWGSFSACLRCSVEDDDTVESYRPPRGRRSIRSNHASPSTELSTLETVRFRSSMTVETGVRAASS
ncbi:hypothetical protein V8E54_010772 [Elaphomyces granulatus]